MMSSPRITSLVHGGAGGVDSEADAIFREVHPGLLRRPIHVYPAHGSRGTYAEPSYRDIARPPLERDRLVVQDADIMFVLAPSRRPPYRRSGTWATYRYALQANVITIVIWPDGSTELAPVREEQS